MRTLLVIMILGFLVGLAVALTRGPAALAPAPLTAPSSPASSARTVERVVALGPGISATLRDMRLASLLVGRHGFDAWCDPALPVCGDQSGLNYESLLSISPSVILTDWGAKPLPERLVTLAKQNHWQLRSFNLLTLDDVGSMIAAIGETLHAPEPARDWQRRLDESLRRDELDLSRAGRVLLLYGGDATPAALGPGSFHHQILVRLGATPALSDGQPFMPITSEDLLRLAPDAIVLIRPRPRGRDASPDADDAAKLLAGMGVMGRLQIPAVASARVALIDDELAAVPGTNLIPVADRLRAILRRWAGTPTQDHR